jgi:hypothetical protein
MTYRVTILWDPGSPTSYEVEARNEGEARKKVFDVLGHSRNTSTKTVLLEQREADDIQATAS